MRLDDFTGVLFSDNSSSHIYEELMAMLARENIRLIIFPPHTSHLFQPFDLVTSAAFTREKREIHVNDPERSQAWQIAKRMKGIGTCHGFIQQPRGLQTSWADNQSPGVSAGGLIGVSPVDRND
jgi:hypothetical protein